jgi:hypothetical protein
MSDRIPGPADPPRAAPPAAGVLAAPAAPPAAGVHAAPAADLVLAEWTDPGAGPDPRGPDALDAVFREHDSEVLGWP